MLDKLQAIEQRYEEAEARLSAPETYEDPALVARLNREQKELAPLVETYRQYQARKRDFADAQALLSDPDMKELAQEEFSSAKADLERLEEELKLLPLPSDPNDGKNVIVEIRAGVGGEEAALFANSLFRMYSMYAAAKNWTVETDSLSETELGGVKEICFTIIGDGAYSRLKFESGVHRVQRVPETESGGRIHTSTVTVAVLPEVDEVDFQLNPADVEMQVFRASGAGGQHVNKTSSAVRLIHKPTGTVVECQQERSQFQNRDKAMRLLASRLYEAELEKQENAVTEQRRTQVGSGMRNERIRTYNFPQGRLTDHRIGLTLYRLDAVMDGDLDEIIDGLVTADRAERLKASKNKEKNDMEMIIRYPALPEGMTQQELEFQLADALDDGGWLLGAGTDAEGNWLDVELEDEKNNPKHAILAVKAYFQNAKFDKATTIELAGKPVGIYE